MLSCFRANTQYTLGEPTKPSMSSVLPEPQRLNVTSCPSTWNLNLITGFLLAPAVDTLLRTYLTTLAPVGTAPAAARLAALVLLLPEPRQVRAAPVLQVQGVKSDGWCPEPQALPPTRSEPVVVFFVTLARPTGSKQGAAAVQTTAEQAP